VTHSGRSISGPTARTVNLEQPTRASSRSCCAARSRRCRRAPQGDDRGEALRRRSPARRLSEDRGEDSRTSTSARPRDEARALELSRASSGRARDLAPFPIRVSSLASLPVRETAIYFGEQSARASRSTLSSSRGAKVRQVERSARSMGYWARVLGFRRRLAHRQRRERRGRGSGTAEITSSPAGRARSSRARASSRGERLVEVREVSSPRSRRGARRGTSAGGASLDRLLEARVGQRLERAGSMIGACLVRCSRFTVAEPSDRRSMSPSASRRLAGRRSASSRAARRPSARSRARRGARSASTRTARIIGTTIHFEPVRYDARERSNSSARSSAARRSAQTIAHEAELRSIPTGGTVEERSERFPSCRKKMTMRRPSSAPGLDVGEHPA